MASMSISFPDDMAEWIERQVATGRYVDASDYVRDLIRDAQDQELDFEYVRAQIEDGLASGSDGTIEDIRREVKAELGLSKEADAA